VHYVITGAAGFLGWHLVTRLLMDGHRVTGLDNYHSGTEANIAALSRHARFAFRHHDVVQPFDLPCEVVCNLACPASPAHYQRNPVYTAEIAFLGTLHALENAERHHAHLLQASTSEVYGDPLVHPQTEDYLGNVNPIGPRACYDEGKRLGETLCADFARSGRVDARVARIFNTYGPNMRSDDGRVVTNLINQALRGEPLTLHGEGRQTRSFCYVDDLVEGLMRLLAAEFNPGPVNLGNPVEVSVWELAEEVQRQLGTRLPIRLEPLPVDDPRRRCPDITKARRVLGGWEPKVPLSEGLARTIAYFRQSAVP
jgi:UDP-glucuronate decarboxylase